MPRFLYFEWDQKEVRALVCEERGDRRKLVGWGAVGLDDAAADSISYAELGDRLGRWLTEQKLGRPAAVGVVNRTLVETCLLDLPPATDAELPEMVAHQALRQSPAINEEATVDFLPFPSQSGESRRALAAAVSAGTLQGVQQLLKRAGLRGERLLFRSLAEVQLVAEVAPEQETILIIAPAGDCVDLTLVSSGQPVLARTVRPPTGLDQEGRQQRVFSEVKRTLVAAPSESLDDGNMDRVVVLGVGDEITESLCEYLRQRMAATVQSIDVAAGFERDESGSGISSSLLGLLVTAGRRSTAGRPTIDFLHPRRPPRRLEKRQAMFLGAAALLLLVGGVWYWIGSQLAELDAEISQLQSRRSELDETLKRTAKQQELAKELRAWDSLSVNWLDELRDFSARIPDENQLVIQRMSLTPSRDRGGAIDIQGLVRDPATVVRLEKRLRDAHHEIRSKRVQERGRGNSYAWHFESAISVKPRDRDQYAAAAGPAEVSANSRPKNEVTRQSDSGRSDGRQAESEGPVKTERDAPEDDSGRPSGRQPS